jgi:chemotaxis protein CheY-P-specific phosphatase CheC
MEATEKQIDAITRLVNTGVAHGASALNTMLNSSVTVEIPFVKLLDPGEAPRHSGILRERLLAIVQMEFSGSLKGNSGLVFQKQSALRLIDSLDGDEIDGDEFDLVTSGIYTEIGNIVLNGVLGYLSNQLGLSLEYVVPAFIEGKLDLLLRNNTSGLLVRTRFKVEDLSADGDIVLFFEPDSYSMLLSMVDRLEA